MPLDLAAATAFMTGHARLLDRRRFAVRVHDDSADGALAALAAYRNPDGGYGSLEPDLRSPESQPVAAMHAFEVLEDVAPVTTPRAAELCDWLASVTLPDGGLPFALPVADPVATAPFWAQADPETSSLHISAAVAAAAHRVAAHDPAVARHPWLATVTGYCLGAIERQGGPTSTLELHYALNLLDAVAGARPDAVDLLARWAGVLPASATVPVEGGADGEVIRPLEFSPRPGGPDRAHIDPRVVDEDLDRLAAEQHDDGGWAVDFESWSPAAAREWRGYATVWAVTTLAAHGRIPPGVASPSG